MGVIRRQSFKYTVVNFVGLGIGAASTLFVYPHALEAYGLVQLLLWFGVVGLPVLSLGGNTLAIRFFPQFDNKGNGHNGLLPLLLTLCMIGWLVAVIIAAFARDSLVQVLQDRSPMLRDYLWMAAPMSLFYVMSVVMGQYSANFKRIVVPSLLIDFSQKIALPILLFSLWQGWISLNAMVWLLLLYSALVPAGMAFYLRSIGQWFWQPNKAFLTPERRREIGRFMVFGSLGGFSLLIAYKADLLFVGSLSTLKSTGVYAIAAFIGSAIDIPTKSLYSASVSSVAQYLAEDKHDELDNLYKKVSINLLTVGLLLFGSVWISVDSFYALLPNGQELVEGKYVLLIIGLSRLVEMTSSLNNYLIYYSRYYTWSLLSLCVLAVANIGFNLWLIPRWGITGAAMATLLSIFCNNAVNLALVWLKFRLQPFSRLTLRAIGLASAAFVTASLIPISGRPWFDLIVRSGIYFAVLCALVYRFRVAPDLADLGDLVLEKIGVKKKK
ncbi:MAG: lipopolysaccharide biosynthesis protein [Saprospiraceae bacterium]|nr:lipopolysaccharide biosynthesis protein [Saprospiraceae bacterium]HNL39396.1 lipopolysaccharide biosynthesis protein [Saprospiraceae bacterium]